MLNLKHIIRTIVFILPFILLSQNNADKITQLEGNKALYKSFNKFYTDYIRNETKDEWGGPYYKKIDQINGVHYFDYNEDGKNDALVEFSARNSDGGTYYFLVAVLFKNTNGVYNYKAHFYPENRRFQKYSKPNFVFSGKTNRFSKEISIKKYVLSGNKFI